MCVIVCVAISNSFLIVGIAWVHSTPVCLKNTSGILLHRNGNVQSENSHPPITSNPIKSHALQSVLRSDADKKGEHRQQEHSACAFGRLPLERRL